MIERRDRQRFVKMMHWKFGDFLGSALREGSCTCKDLGLFADSALANVEHQSSQFTTNYKFLSSWLRHLVLGDFEDRKQVRRALRDWV